MLLRRYDIDNLAQRLDRRAATLRNDGATDLANDLALAAELARESGRRMGGHEFGPEPYDFGWFSMKEVTLRA